MANTDRPNKIKISCDQIAAEAVLNDSATAKDVWKALPFESEAQTWGNEVYFSIPVVLEAENQKELVEMGDLAYWPPGSALCIFFGRTPASRGDEIRPASPVNVIGKVKDPEVFKKVKNGSRIRVERIL